MSALRRNNVRLAGSGRQAMIFAHGFGCDQNMWRFVWPSFQDRYQIVLFDHVGAGGADASAYDKAESSTLEGYADDILDICDELKLKDSIFVGHSVAAMMGVLAANKQPARFADLVLVGPSPRYINDDDYVGGFSREDMEGLLETLASNHLGWSSTMAPVIMANPDRPELGQELMNSFCRMDPDIAAHFARVTFFSDNRADLTRLTTPSLILQCCDDVIAPDVVGDYVHAHLRNSTLVKMAATGHCPNLSAPDETTRAIDTFLTRPR